MQSEFGLFPLRRSSKSAVRSEVMTRGRACLATVLVSTLIFLVTGCDKKEVRAAVAPPDVEVATVVERDVPVYEEFVAQLNGPVNADITPKVQGYLLTQNYVNGSLVKKGQLLFQIDPRPFQAALDEAKAETARTVATLAKATNDVQRDTPLAAQNAIPQKQLDDDLSNQNWARAEVTAKQAAEQQADLNLGWTKVYSPVDGIVGVANSQVGDLVGTTTKMTTVSQIDPIWAYFNISEALYLTVAPRISQVLQRGLVGSSVPVEYIQADDIPYPFKGNVIFVNREITAGTGTIQLAAAFPNKDAILRPGGFGRVRVQTGTSKNAMLIPQPAVMEVQSEYQVIVVSVDKKAAVRPVKVGDRVGSDWIITEGLKEGEQVVAEGIQKVQTLAAQSPELAKEGIPVTPQPYAAPSKGN